MDSPYLESGESIILTTDRVSINSQQYDLLLTTKYLILIDIRYARFQPQKIPLKSILSVKAGKIATGDLAITLYFSDRGQPGGSDQMNLIFSRQPGEQRDRERDEWLKNLMDFVVAGRQETIDPGTPPINQDIGIRPATRRQIAPEMQLPHSTIIESRPAQIELAVIHDEPKEEAFPEQPSSEAGDAELAEEGFSDTLSEEPPSPDRVTPDEPEISTPGVPPEEITGFGIPGDADAEEMLADSGEHPALRDAESPAIPKIIGSVSSREELTGLINPDTPAPEETSEDVQEESVSPARLSEEPGSTVPIPSLDEPAGSVVPGTIVPEEMPAGALVEKASPDRVLEEPEIIIPVPSREEPARTVIPDTKLPEEAVTDSETPSYSGVQPAAPEPLLVEPPGTVEEGEGRSETGVPEEGRQNEPTGQPEESALSAPGSPLPPTGAGANRHTSFMIVVAILILILGIAGVAVFFPAYLGTPALELSPVPTSSLPQTTVPLPSTIATPAPAQVVIPNSGVWVRVTYPQDYYGRLGNPGSLREVAGSGDRFYQMNTDNRLVQVQMYKADNSGDILTLEIYRDGELIARRMTSSPRGFIDILIDATTGAPPGIAPRISLVPSTVPSTTQTSQAGNQTIVPEGNQTLPAPVQTIISPVNETPQNTNHTNNQTSTGNRVMYF